MGKTEIKICGIRRPEDCVYVNEAMPDFAGFIFWNKSFRNVSIEEALRLRLKIDAKIRTVGVFVDETKERICDIVNDGIVSVVQLHGSEDKGYIEALRRRLSDGIEIWKAYKIRSRKDIEAAIASEADRILLDNGYGTGECFDHSLMDDDRLNNRGFILAGGMTPENIPEAIRLYAPDMIDISSGVETNKVKDREKILKAVYAVRSFSDT